MLQIDWHGVCVVRALYGFIYGRVRILVMKTDPKRLCNGWTETEVETWYGGKRLGNLVLQINSDKMRRF